MAIALSTTGSLGPAFASARLVGLTVKLPYTHMLFRPIADRAEEKVLTYTRFGGLPENLKLDSISWQDTPLKEIFSDLESAVRKELDKNANHSKKEFIENFEITLLLEDDEAYERKKSYHFKNSSIESIISTLSEENQLHYKGHSATDEQFYIVPLHPSILIGADDRIN